MSSVCCVSALLSLLLGWWLKKRNFELQPELYKNCHQCTNSIFSHLFVECMVLSFYLQFLWEGAIFSGWCVVENVLERRLLLAQNPIEFTIPLQPQPKKNNPFWPDVFNSIEVNTHPTHPCIHCNHDSKLWRGSLWKITLLRLRFSAQKTDWTLLLPMWCLL